MQEMSDPADERIGPSADVEQGAPTTEVVPALAVMRYLHQERGAKVWTLMTTVARRLNVEISAIEGAVKVGVDNGWMISNGDPGEAVCLTDYGSAEIPRLGRGA